MAVVIIGLERLGELGAMEPKGVRVLAELGSNANRRGRTT